MTKTLINITARIYRGSAIAHNERTYSFVRGRGTKAPTYAGAARMVAKATGFKPSDIAVTRVEGVVFVS
jgi:hypothetical protein